jgi:hypothetical protein
MRIQRILETFPLERSRIALLLREIYFLMKLIQKSIQG